MGETGRFAGAAFRVSIIAGLLIGGSAVGRAETTDEIVVTGARRPEAAGDSASLVTVIDRDALDRQPAFRIDDALRSLPAFSLFRRASSRVAQPTTQGVALRGIGPTGASRALVLVDGVPANDPFGGWVYWSRLPVERLERIEVTEGGGAGLWGSHALSGVVALETRAPAASALHARALGGSHGTVDVALDGSERLGPVGVGLGGTLFRTDGWYVVDAAERGAVDERVTSEHLRGDLRAVLPLDADTSVGATVGAFLEDRENGTRLTGNGSRAFAARLDGRTRVGELALDGGLFYDARRFESTFSAVSDDRMSERPALDQFDVPVESGGGRLVGAIDLAGHALAAGADLRFASGETNEDFRFVDGAFTRRRRAGGDEGWYGLFLRDGFDVGSRVRVSAGARLDGWWLADGRRRETDLETGDPLVDERFRDRSELRVNPHVGLRVLVAEGLSLRGAAYRAYRAPTLNELYRPFRVGNDITEANPELDPEALAGGELGADLDRGAIRARLTGFWNELEDPIFNVTLAEGEGAVVEPCGFVPAGGSCRQRRNLGRARVRGVELDLGWTATRWLELETRYAFTDARVTRAPGAPELEGKRLVQTPRHQVVLAAHAEHPALGRLSATLRYAGPVFEDDLNTRELDELVSVDLSLGRELAPGCTVFAGVENLLDRRNEVSRSGAGLVTTGTPLGVHAGVSVAL